MATKRVRDILVFSDWGVPGTEALAERHQLRCPWPLVGEQGLGLEKGPAYGAWAPGMGEAL